jgi:colanic acid/amylovoran biosynthesis glycosyltransferase
VKSNRGPTVVVFNDHLLYPSETFIRNQAQALARFKAVFAGSRKVPGLNLPDEHTYTINQGNLSGRVNELIFKLFGRAPNLVKKLAELNPVLVHAHHGPNGLRALPLAKKLKLPIIVTFHGSDATATNLRFRETYFGHHQYLRHKEELQRDGALFIAVSQFVRRKLLAQGFPDYKTIVHYTGVDTKVFQPASTEFEPIILFVGRLTEQKGAQFLIRATAEIQKQLPAVELVLIGDGDLRTDLEKEAKETLRRYRFLGVRGPDEVRQWFNRASVFCAPSVKTYSGQEEAIGMVYAEAQAMSKPVVAFDSGGISEVVSHGHTGFLAPERDWQALATYLSMLLRDIDLRKQLGRAGRERMIAEFDLEKRTAILEAIYSKVSGTEVLLPKRASSSSHGALSCY